MEVLDEFESEGVKYIIEKCEENYFITVIKCDSSVRYRVRIKDAMLFMLFPDMCEKIIEKYCKSKPIAERNYYDFLRSQPRLASVCIRYLKCKHNIELDSEDMLSIFFYLRMFGYKFKSPSTYIIKIPNFPLCGLNYKKFIQVSERWIFARAYQNKNVFFLLPYPFEGWVDKYVKIPPIRNKENLKVFRGFLNGGGV